jgi:DNA-binding LytR/AlgR family response regulator
MQAGLRLACRVMFEVKGMSTQEQLLRHPHFSKRPQRMLVKKGAETHMLKISEAALFYIEKNVVFVIDCQGKKFICDRSLTSMEADLDPRLFFRLSRQHIVNIEAIKSFRSYERVKLEVKLTIEGSMPLLIVSQQTAPLFKKWICES